MTNQSPTSPIAELFKSEIPPELWHYTSVDGARGIVGTNTIWATDSMHLNDQTEIVHFLGLAREVMSGISIQSASVFGHAAVEESIEVEFTKGLLSNNRSQFFIASFSAGADDLGQWRAYAQNAKGVAIGFDLRNIRPPLELKSMVTFAPCVYDDYSKKLLIATLITSFFDGEKEVQEQLTNPLWRSQQLANWNLVQRALGLKEDRAGYRDHIQAMFQETMKENKIRFRANLMRLACHFKHSGFKDEQEWRLVLPHLRSKTDITSPIMTRGGGMIPYVAFDLRNLRFGGITRFMLAPCCESTEEEALRQAGYDGIIETSRIPLRCG